MLWYERIIEKATTLKYLKVLQALREERGAIFVLTALMLPVIFGFMGIAYDAGNLYMHKARLQNVADSAALAGARAYLDSQKKTQGVKDSVDTTTTSDKSETYEIGGGSKSRGLPHADADTAADEYINKNIVNLGNTVKSDKYSHYALNSTGNNPKTFYRIGLYEEVPLYFLPVVLKNKTKQIVRAGAIALVEPGTPTSTGGSVIIDPTATFSIFDNLFTYSDTFHTRHTDHVINDHVITGFQGDMVYTHGSNDYAYFYTLQDHYLTHHYYTTTGGHAGNTINDTVINTVFDTTAYLEAFQIKLLEPHVDLHDQNFYLTGNGTINNSCETYINGKRVRKVGEEYYPLDESGNHMTLTNNGETYVLCYRKFPPEAWDSPYMLCAKQQQVTTTTESGTYNGNPGVKTQSTMKYFLLNSNNQLTNCYIEMTSWTIKYQYWTDGPHSSTSAYVEKNGVKYELKYSSGAFTYGDANLPLSAVIEPSGNLSAPVTQNEITTKTNSGGSTNIFHASKDNIPNLKIWINSEMTGDTPIYVIVDPDITEVWIYGNASNNRPLILVCLGAANVWYDYTGQHFKGTIYVPLGSIDPLNVVVEGQKFSGSAIAKSLDVEGTQDNGVFEQVNYLTDDIDVKAVTDKIKEKMDDANSKLTDSYLQQLADNFNGLSYADGENGPTKTLTVTKDNLADMNWYNNLSYWEKQGLYQKWKILYENETDPNKKDLLWLWSSVFKKTENGSGSSTVSGNDNLRLINYSTEFKEGDPEVNPFRSLTLGEPNSY